MADYTKLSDEQLVEVVRRQDKEAYTQIINRYQKKLMRYASYITQNSDKAADAIQNAFIKAYINLNGFKVKKKFSSWLYRIAHNEAVNSFDRHRRHLTLELNQDWDSGIDLEDELVKKELKAQTRNCLKQLPVLYREPLALYFLEDKSYEDISDILRLPVGTVGTRISRAKILMKKICQENR